MDKNKILKRVRRRMELDDDKNRDADCQAYRDIDNMEWEPPFKLQPWMRKRVSSVGHNGLKTVINLFNTYKPKWDILPRGVADAEAAQRLEDWLEWEMLMTNRRGLKEPFREMLNNSALDGACAAQLDYLPYWCPDGQSEEKKILLESGSFSINVVDLMNIRYEVGQNGVRWVAQVTNVPSTYIFDRWESYENDGIQAALSKIRSMIEGLEEDEHFIYMDYTDNKRRWVRALKVDRKTIRPSDVSLLAGDGAIDIIDEENKLPFINWAIAEASGDPLFKSAHYSGSWENANFMLTLTDSSVIRRAYFPILKHKSASGEPLDVDFSGVEPVIEDKPGDDTQTLAPPPIDSGLRELLDRNEVNMSQDLGVRGLQMSDVVGNLQYATLAAQLQIGKNVLDPHLRAVERAAVELAKLAFLWVKYTEDTVTAYITKTRKTSKRGEKINISGKDFDPRRLVIECEIMANLPTDEMQRWNMFAGVIQTGAPLPFSEIFEQMEWGDYESLNEKHVQEKIERAAIDMFIQKQNAKMQMQVQQEAQAAQQQAMQAAAQQSQGQPPPQQGAGNPALDPVQGQGFDPSQGGTPPAMAAPELTQTRTRDEPI